RPPDEIAADRLAFSLRLRAIPIVAGTFPRRQCGLPGARARRPTAERAGVCVFRNPDVVPQGAGGQKRGNLAEGGGTAGHHLVRPDRLRPGDAAAGADPLAVTRADVLRLGLGPLYRLASGPITERHA